MGPFKFFWNFLGMLPLLFGHVYPVPSWKHCLNSSPKLYIIVFSFVPFPLHFLSDLNHCMTLHCIICMQMTLTALYLAMTSPKFLLYVFFSLLNSSPRMFHWLSHFRHQKFNSSITLVSSFSCLLCDDIFSLSITMLIEQRLLPDIDWTFWLFYFCQFHMEILIPHVLSSAPRYLSLPSRLQSRNLGVLVPDCMPCVLTKPCGSF